MPAEVVASGYALLLISAQVFASYAEGLRTGHLVMLWLSVAAVGRCRGTGSRGEHELHKAKEAIIEAADRLMINARWMMSVQLPVQRSYINLETPT